MKPIERTHFLIGAEKCGTTSLANWLGQHPHIQVSRPKDTTFFTRDYHKGVHWYYSRFFHEIYRPHGSSMPVFLDCRPQNMLVPFVTERIKETVINPKFIFIVREPVERCYSAWQHFNRMRPGRESRTFEKAMEDNFKNWSASKFESEYEYMSQLDPMGGCYADVYLEQSEYARHIQRFADAFNMSDIHILTLDDLIANPRHQLDLCVHFLGEDHKHPMFKPQLIAQNQSLVPTAKLDLFDIYPSTWYKLKRAFAEGVLELSKIMNRDLITEWGYKDMGVYDFSGS